MTQDGHDVLAHNGVDPRDRSHPLKLVIETYARTHLVRQDKGGPDIPTATWEL